MTVETLELSQGSIEQQTADLIRNFKAYIRQQLPTWRRLPYWGLRCNGLRYLDQDVMYSIRHNIWRLRPKNASHYLFVDISLVDGEPTIDGDGDWSESSWLQFLPHVTEFDAAAILAKYMTRAHPDDCRCNPCNSPVGHDFASRLQVGLRDTYDPTVKLADFKAEAATRWGLTT